MSISLPAALAQLITNQSTDFQNLGYELYALIAAVPTGDVVGPGVAVNLNIAVFDGTTGKLIKDGGQTIAAVIAAAVAASGNVNGPGSSTSGDIPQFADTTGKLLSDSGVLASTVVKGPASAADGNLAVFDGTTGKLIKDGGTSVAGFLQIVSVKLSSGDLSTSSTTFTDMVGLTATLTTGAHRCLVTAMLNIQNTTTGNVQIDISIDGTLQGGTSGLIIVGGIATQPNEFASIQFWTPVLTAAAHTIKLQWKANAGTTNTCKAGAVCPAVFQVVETSLAT